MTFKACKCNTHSSVLGHKHHAIRTYGGVEVNFHDLLISVADRDVW